MKPLGTAGIFAAAIAVAMASVRAEVVVLVGTVEGRTTREPDAATVNEPFAVAFDASGTMYGVEYLRGNRLFRTTSTGGVEFVAGRFRAGRQGEDFPPDTETAAADVRFNGLHDVAIGPDGIVYVADTFAHRIRAFDPRSKTVAVVAGTGRPGFSGDGGPAVDAAFNQAYCCSLSPRGAALLVADIANRRLRRVDLTDRSVATVAGNGEKGKPTDGATAVETPLTGPRAACMTDDGSIYLALREGNALLEIRKGVIRTVVNASGKAGYGGDGGPGRDALLAGPKYVALDREGRVLIADTENHCIRRYDPRTGRIVLIAGLPRQAGATVGGNLLATKLARPHGCCIGPDGRLFIADSDNDRILAGPADDEQPPGASAAGPQTPR